MQHTCRTRETAWKWSDQVQKPCEHAKLHTDAHGIAIHTDTAGNAQETISTGTHGTGLGQDLGTCTLVVPVHFKAPEGPEVSR